MNDPSLSEHDELLERLQSTGQQLFERCEQLEGWLSRRGFRRVLLVVDRRAVTSGKLEETLESTFANKDVACFDQITPNPSLELAELAAEVARAHRAEVVIGIGGGSSIDLAKLAALGAADARWADPLPSEATLSRLSPLPLAAIPTTTGSGSEATHFAVAYEGAIKRSVVHARIRPEAVVLDERFVVGMPPSLAAVTGLDALSQSLESLWAVGATAASCRDALMAATLIAPRIIDSAFRPLDGDRRTMLLGAHLAGQAINVSKTTASHALSYRLTKQFEIPHGLAVALTLGRVAAWNAKVTELDCLDSRGHRWVRQQVETASQCLGTSPQGMPDRIADLLRQLQLPASLREAGVGREAIADLAASVDPVRLGNNPRRFQSADLESLLADC